MSLPTRISLWIFSLFHEQDTVKDLMEEPAIVVPHLVVAVYIPSLSLCLHKLFSRNMSNTSVLRSRQDRRPWGLTNDLSVLFCFHDYIYCLVLIYKEKPGKPTKKCALWFT